MGRLRKQTTPMAGQSRAGSDTVKTNARKNRANPVLLPNFVEAQESEELEKRHCDSPFSRRQTETR